MEISKMLIRRMEPDTSRICTVCPFCRVPQYLIYTTIIPTHSRLIGYDCVCCERVSFMYYESDFRILSSTLVSTSRKPDEIVNFIQNKARVLIVIGEMRQTPVIPQNLEPVKVTLSSKRYKEVVVSEINNKTYRSLHGTDNLECCICLEAFKKGCTIHRTRCNHHFHPKCLGRYLKKECITPACPMCRKDLREI